MAIRQKPLSVPDFRAAITHAGLEPPDLIEHGMIHRFPGRGKRSGNRAGWCFLFSDGLGGSFGDWSSGFSENWQVRRVVPYSTAERDAFARRVSLAKAQAKAEGRVRQADAADRASAIWKTAIETQDNHPYLVKKMIRPHAARIYKGLLTLPIIGFDGELRSLQFINADGTKRFLTGGRTLGCFIPVNFAYCAASAYTNLDSKITGSGNSAYSAVSAYRNRKTKSPERILICEGWATGCTLDEYHQESPVIACLNAGNLKPVAMTARGQWPSTEIIIAGDDDRQTNGNPGRTKAIEAAIAANALVAFPQWPANAPFHLTDFNDLAAWTAKGAGS